MKRNLLVPVLLTLGLLAGCGVPAGEAVTPSPAPPEESAPPADSVEMTCRIVDGAEAGVLMLAEVENGPYDGGGVYSFAVGETPVWIDGERKTAADLTDGMLVTVCWNGMVAESYPAQLGETYSLRAESADTDDHCGLYLQVLSDLWDASGGLNEGVEELGVDLSGVPGLTPSERSAIAWAFGQDHGLFPVEGTLEELREQGYLTPMAEPAEDYEDSLAYYQWEKGCHFSIDVDEDAVWSLPMLTEGEEPPELVAFDARKWRSGLGAYFFDDCTAQRGEDGTWTYTVGAEMIS